MKNFAKGKIMRLVTLAIALMVGVTGLILSFTVFNVNTAGATLSFSEGGHDGENIEAISPTYDGSGYFVTSYYSEQGERKSVVKKVGADNSIEFESQLVQAKNGEDVDNGVFSYVIGVTENRVIAFTSSWYYLYEYTESGLNLLDTYHGSVNIGAGLGIRNYSFDVRDGNIYIYTVDCKGSNSASIAVFAEKVTIKNDKFEGSIYNEIKRTSGKRLTNMGAQALGVAVTEDGENVMVAFSSGRAVMFSSDIVSLNVSSVDEYNANVKTLQVGKDGNSITAAQDDGNGILYVFTQNGNVTRITKQSFIDGENKAFTPDVVTTLNEYGSYCSFDPHSNTLYTVNEDGNTLYSINTEENKLDYSVSLKFKIKNIVTSEDANALVCQWQNNVTEKIEYTVYEYNKLKMIDVAKVGKIIAIIIGIVGLVVALFIASLYIFADFGRIVVEKLKWFFAGVWQAKWIYLIILPSFVLLFLFSIYPSVASMINSFFEYELGKPKIFVGFANYEELFVTNKGLFLEIGRNTLLLVGTYLFTQIVPPVIYAYLIMLLRNKNSVKVIRWFMYIPGLLPTIAAMLMWRYGIYGINPDGALNIIIRAFGGEPIPFLGNSKYAIWSILFIGFPWVGGFLLFYGALMTVPTEVYDACELEGCGLIKRFFVIDLPFIMGQVKYVSIGAIIAGVKSVGRIMATTDGQMGTMTLMYKLYEYLNKNQYGMASTIAVIMVVLLAGISFARVKKMLKKENSYD